MKTVTFDEARRKFARMFALAAKGETVVIERDDQRVALHGLQDKASAAMEIPIPRRPPGYFAHCYTKAEIEQDNRLAKASVLRAPKDLE